MQLVRSITIFALAAFVGGAGLMHFITPQFFIDIVPDYLPAPEALVAISGVFEILGAIGLLVPMTRRLAAWGLIALFIAVFPANIHMATHHITPTGMPPLPAWMPWARLPLQAALIWWAYTIARWSRPRSSDSDTAS